MQPGPGQHQTSQFQQVMERMDRLEKLLMQVIHMLGPRLDQDSLREGMEEPISISGEGDLFPDTERMPFLKEQDPNEQQPFFNLENEKPRLSLPFKTKDGGEAFVNWNALDPDMQQVIEIARRKDDPWQLYESASGQMRIGISSEVEAEFRSWKMGNQIGK